MNEARTAWAEPVMVITTTCPRCGTVELTVGDVVLIRSPREGLAWYQFDCLGCVTRVVKPAPGVVALALSDLEVQTWTVPAEILERQDAPGPLTVDDVLDGVLALRRSEDVLDLV